MGPASREPAPLDALLAAGVDGFRVNFSHGVADEHRSRSSAPVHPRASEPLSSFVHRPSRPTVMRHRASHVPRGVEVDTPLLPRPALRASGSSPSTINTTDTRDEGDTPAARDTTLDTPATGAGDQVP